MKIQGEVSRVNGFRLGELKIMSDWARSAGVSRSQSQTSTFQRPGGRGTFQTAEPSRLTSSIDPSLVRSSNRFNASRDPSGDQQTLADV
jgi:hypothetical protein